MRVAATALWAALVAAHEVRAAADGSEEASSAVIAKHYIVEYEPGTSRMASVDDEIVVLKSFESSVFSGAHVQTDTYNLDTLARVRGVKNVWPNQHIQLAPTEPLARPGALAASGEYDPHNATGVGKLHALGFYGEGVVVGVVDTGTAYKHPALGGGFGPGFKVEGGYDFVGDRSWPNGGTKEPDGDPDDQQGHGTHVAGIIAGESDFGWVGVAPKATLRSYKVFSQAGSTDTATLIESFLMAYSDGVDIITASIGGASGWAENAWGVVASRLVDEGVVVTISAGNSGSDGPFFGTNGAYGTNVVAVASIASERLPATPFAVTFNEAAGGNRTDIEGYLPASGYYPPNIADWEVRPMSFNTSAPADGCEPYPADTPRLEGVIPMVRRGTCSFAIKQTNLAALGAEYMLFYNNESPMTTPSSVDDTTHIALITAELGGAIIATVKSGGNVTADFSVNPERPVGVGYAAGGLASTFTSWGGTYDLAIKPDVAAPGGNIYSTYLDGGYAVLSGTSMACPYVAGVAALYIGAHGGRARHGPGFARSLGRRLIASGRSVPWYNGAGRPNYDLPAPVAQVGTGLIDAFKVVRYKTAIDFEKMALNDTHHFNRYHSVRLTHDADAEAPVTFRFTQEPAAGFEVAGWFPLGTTPGEYRVKKFEELTPKPLVVPAFLPDTITLRPGETKDVPIAFDPPDRLGWNSSALPLYSGKVLISGSNGEQFSVPYMGIASNLEREVKPIFRTTYPFSKSTVQFIDIKEKPYYTFNLSTAAQDFPKIYTKLVWGTREIRWDIFEADWHEYSWTYPPVPGEAGYIGTVASWVGAGQVGSFFDPASQDADDTFSFPVRDVTRNAFSALSFGEYWWFGKLGNGSQIANGKYIMRFAALRPFGNPAAADNWDVFKVPQIQVLGHY